MGKKRPANAGPAIRQEWILKYIEEHGPVCRDTAPFMEAYHERYPHLKLTEHRGKRFVLRAYVDCWSLAKRGELISENLANGPGRRSQYDRYNAYFSLPVPTKEPLLNRKPDQINERHEGMYVRWPHKTGRRTDQLGGVLVEYGPKTCRVKTGKSSLGIISVKTAQIHLWVRENEIRKLKPKPLDPAASGHPQPKRQAQAAPEPAPAGGMDSTPASTPTIADSPPAPTTNGQPKAPPPADIDEDAHVQAVLEGWRTTRADLKAAQAMVENARRTLANAQSLMGEEAQRFRAFDEQLKRLAPTQDSTHAND